MQSTHSSPSFPVLTFQSFSQESLKVEVFCRSVVLQHVPVSSLQEIQACATTTIITITTTTPFPALRPT